MSFIAELGEILSDPSVSDIRLHPHHPIWVRKAGELVRLEGKVVTPAQIDEVAALRYEKRQVRTELSQRGGQDDFALDIGVAARVRVNAFLAGGQPAFAIRRLATDPPTAKAIGLPAVALEMASRSQGLILVTGPTGSGKSSTLAAMLRHINETSSANIITLEDPIEFVHKDINCRIAQREVREEDADCRSFAEGIVAALRQDPDVIMVGEMRDAETMRACLTAAQTGHLVLGTLHTNSAIETINRVLSFFDSSERELQQNILSAVLLGVFSQQLLRSRSGGRALAQEIMIANPEVSTAIRTDVTALKNAMDMGQSAGQRTMNLHLSQLVREDIVLPETAFSVSPDSVDLRAKLGMRA